MSGICESQPEQLSQLLPDSPQPATSREVFDATVAALVKTIAHGTQYDNMVVVSVSM